MPRYDFFTRTDADKTTPVDQLPSFSESLELETTARTIAETWAKKKGMIEVIWTRRDSGTWNYTRKR